MTVEQVLPLVVPLLILEVALIAFALYDLTRPERQVRGGNKVVWAIVIVIFQLLGPLIYFLVGREDS